jgi:hypothetical protein
MSAILSQRVYSPPPLSSFPFKPRSVFFVVAVIVSFFWSTRLAAQNPMIVLPPHPSPPGYLDPNRPPDANEQMQMRALHQRASNFDAANALRKKQIDDESMKLLILASDLKKQMDKLGNQPPSSRLLREAEVIELLAHDVQTRMVLTVGGG